MQQYLSFAKWLLQSSLKSLSFWGLMSILLGLFVVWLSGEPGLISNTVILCGAALIIADAARAWFQLSYSMYQNEQQEIVRKLTKDQS